MDRYRKGDELSVGMLDLGWVLKTTWIMDALKEYFRYEVVGLEKIPAKGPAVVVMNHGLLAVDALLLGLEVFRETGRVLRTLAAHFVFQIPIIRRFFLSAGVVDGNQVTAEQLLEQGEIVAIMPGGVREACKPTSQQYSLRWEGRTGFVSLALRHSVPVIPAACVGNDELFYVFNDGVDTARRMGLKNLPLPLFLGLGLLPLPSKLTHYIGEPIRFDEEVSATADQESLERLRLRVQCAMEYLLAYGLEQRDRAGHRIL